MNNSQADTHVDVARLVETLTCILEAIESTNRQLKMQFEHNKETTAALRDLKELVDQRQPELAQQ